MANTGIRYDVKSYIVGGWQWYRQSESWWETATGWYVFSTDGGWWLCTKWDSFAHKEHGYIEFHLTERGVKEALRLAADAIKRRAWREEWWNLPAAQQD
jgi:hypothetical protein